MDPIIKERRVAAPPATVFAYFTDSVRWATWQGIGASIDARPGGLFSVLMVNGMTAAGQFVELLPDQRVVFTWGWIDHPVLPPGSTTVTVELIPEGDGTLIRLTHEDLPEEERGLHAAGWDHYLSRLVQVAAGLDPGTDRGPG
ncbi:MAG: SRPBCC family protein [Acidimicrobiia bacterium]